MTTTSQLGRGCDLQDKKHADRRFYVGQARWLLPGGKHSLANCGAAWRRQRPAEHAVVVDAGDEYLVQRAVECLLEDLDDDEAFQRLTPEERAAALGWVLAGLVGNGGFEAWVESLGQRTPDAVVGLRLLGADAYAALLEQVARLYPTVGAADADTRLSAMDDWGDREVSRLHHLTQQFFELQQAHDLEEQFVAPFVRAHPRQFPMRVEDL